MITNYSEFLVEQAISMINESEVAYSQKFRKLLKDIDSPVSKALSEVETKDFDVVNNYFDITDNKDSISFITDRKAKEILAGESKYAIYSDGPLLTHNMEQNGTIFELLNYTPEGSEPYHPEEGEKGEIISKAVSPTSGKVYVRLKFPEGECVINQERLRSDDLTKEVWSKNRQSIRVGRGIRALLTSAGKEFTAAEIEDFVNKYKSAFERMNNIFRYFELVSGDDIAYWYSKKNYLYGLNKGTLGNSCMADVPSRYFQIYTQNPDVCSLLILKSESDPTKIIGRALVWKLSSPEITFMDRIYYTEDSQMQLFRDYAKLKKWYSKKRNDSSPEAVVITPDGDEKNFDVLVCNIKKGSYSNYPYVDTLKYYEDWKGVLSTDQNTGSSICLESTSGGYEGSECDRCGGEGRVDCWRCDGEGNVDCSTCDGNGEVECNKCEGNGEVECNRCDGSGKMECDECDGSGEVDGETCSNCDGDGEVDCDNCDGKGKMECPSCDGNGEVECDDCDGRGREDCPECGGDEYLDCPDCN